MANQKSDKRIQQLALKWLRGELSDTEKQAFNAWYESFDDTLLESETDESPEALRDRLYQQILKKEAISAKPRIRPLTVTLRIAAAAMVLLFMGLGIYLLINNSSNKQHKTQLVHHQNDTILPGGNKAILTLADGSHVVLDTSRIGLLTQTGNIAIRKTAQGQIVYDLQQKAPHSITSETTYNSIRTPAGGEYQVVLPDGSKVWLNALSTLTFPTQFLGTERKVELSGEAYFEVEKDKEKPFSVAVNGTTVQVLGTQFNIMGYPDEKSTNVTLLGGSVRVNKATFSKLIVPGQQAKVNDQIQVLDVETDQAIAWKNGLFVFDNENIQEIMRKIARWYDVEIAYEGNITQKKFGGSISKYEQLADVLQIMEQTDVIHFKIQERRIWVMP